MSASAIRIVAMLAFVAATSVAQQPPSAMPTLDEVTVSGPKERERGRDRLVAVKDDNKVTLRLEDTIGVRLLFEKQHTQVVFRGSSAARKLPEPGHELSKLNQTLHLDLLPDRLIAQQRPWILTAGYQLAANVDEPDGVPAHIPFGQGVALVNLDHVSLRDNERLTSISLSNTMHPQTRRCESHFWIVDLWADGTNPYVLVGNSAYNCRRTVKRREGDLLFAENVPAALVQAVRELQDPIASRLASRLGSEPGNMFITWLPESPRDDYRFRLSWNRNSLLHFNGSGWKRGIDAAQRESLRVLFMREQIQRRIRESDWPGPFTQSAVNYLLLLTLSEETRTTRRWLSQELPAWVAGCAVRIQESRGSGNRGEDVSSRECGLVLQFVYDAVARSRSAGRQNIYSTWRRLLDASYRRKSSGATPAEFLASSIDARRIAQGLVDGSVEWPAFVAALDDVGVKLKAISGGVSPAFEVESLEHFGD